MRCALIVLPMLLGSETSAMTQMGSGIDLPLQDLSKITAGAHRGGRHALRGLFFGFDDQASWREKGRETAGKRTRAGVRAALCGIHHAVSQYDAPCNL